MGARRDHDVPGSHGGRPCKRRGQRPAWGSTACRVCCRSGGGGRARRRARTRCGRLCDQGRTCGRAGRRGREGRTTRVPVAARPAPGGDSRARTRRPAVAERHLLVGRGASAAQRAHRADAVSGPSSRPLCGTGVPARGPWCGSSAPLQQAIQPLELVLAQEWLHFPFPDRIVLAPEVRLPKSRQRSLAWPRQAAARPHPAG
jgi:hypothetical protein